METPALSFSDLLNGEFFPDGAEEDEDEDDDDDEPRYRKSMSNGTRLMPARNKRQRRARDSQKEIELVDLTTDDDEYVPPKVTVSRNFLNGRMITFVGYTKNPLDDDPQDQDARSPEAEPSQSQCGTSPEQNSHPLELGSEQNNIPNEHIDQSSTTRDPECHPGQLSEAKANPCEPDSNIYAELNSLSDVEGCDPKSGAHDVQDDRCAEFTDPAIPENSKVILASIVHQTPESVPSDPEPGTDATEAANQSLCLQDPVPESGAHHQNQVNTLTDEGGDEDLCIPPTRSCELEVHEFVEPPDKDMEYGEVPTATDVSSDSDAESGNETEIFGMVSNQARATGSDGSSSTLRMPVTSFTQLIQISPDDLEMENQSARGSLENMAGRSSVDPPPIPNTSGNYNCRSWKWRESNSKIATDDDDPVTINGKTDNLTKHDRQNVRFGNMLLCDGESGVLESEPNTPSLPRPIHKIKRRRHRRGPKTPDNPDSESDTAPEASIRKPKRKRRRKDEDEDDSTSSFIPPVETDLSDEILIQLPVVSIERIDHILEHGGTIRFPKRGVSQPSQEIFQPLIATKESPNGIGSKPLNGAKQVDVSNEVLSPSTSKAVQMQITATRYGRLSKPTEFHPGYVPSNVASDASASG